MLPHIHTVLHGPGADLTCRPWYLLGAVMLLLVAVVATLVLLACRADAGTC